MGALTGPVRQRQVPSWMYDYEDTGDNYLCWDKWDEMNLTVYEWGGY